MTTALQKTNFIPQARDLWLLKLLCTFGYMTGPQIFHFVLNGNLDATYRRMRKLQEYGFLETRLLHEAFGQVVYIPNSKVVRSILLDSEILSRLDTTVRSTPWTTEHPEHDLRVRDIALSLLRLVPEADVKLSHLLNSKDWWGDINEKSGIVKVPDLSLELNGKRLAIVEIELTQKSENRYVHIFRKLIERCDCPIIYLVRGPAIGKAITRCFNDVAQSKGWSGGQIPKLIVRDIAELKIFSDLEILVSSIVGPEHHMQIGNAPIHTPVFFGTGVWAGRPELKLLRKSKEFGKLPRNRPC